MSPPSFAAIGGVAGRSPHGWALPSSRSDLDGVGRPHRREFDTALTQASLAWVVTVGVDTTGARRAKHATGSSLLVWWWALEARVVRSTSDCAARRLQPKTQGKEATRLHVSLQPSEITYVAFLCVGALAGRRAPSSRRRAVEPPAAVLRRSARRRITLPDSHNPVPRGHEEEEDTTHK
ncbi:hypothetical protein ZWY2020_047196 [Hordeum vulgare]|nr:hypothetical protein ZWY2020_047196 [Hordeum vulgare]